MTNKKPRQIMVNRLPGFGLIAAFLISTAPPTAAEPIAASLTPVQTARQSRSPLAEAQRRQAVIRGLRFIHRHALEPTNFAQYGSDYLWCFYTIGASVDDREVREMARTIGVELAIRWRRLHPELPKHVTASRLVDFIHGSDAANSLGVRDEKLDAQIAGAVRGFKTTDFFSFDPRTEPPPTDVPAECIFDQTRNRRGARVCSRCQRRLTMRSRYDVWCEALVDAYTAEHLGVSLGAEYQDVLKWLKSMRPYPRGKSSSDKDFIHSVYAITHVVYTLNDYGQYTLPAQLLPDEYQFLKRSLRRTILRRDPDMLGEIIDSLKSMGVGETDRDLRQGIDYLLAHQNADGSWGNPQARDNYDRYHTTWNGIAALSNYSWRGMSPRVDRLKLLD